MNEITIYLTTSIGRGFVGNKKYPENFTLGELVEQETGQDEERAFNNYFIRVNRSPDSSTDGSLVLINGMRVSITPKKIDGGSN